MAHTRTQPVSPHKKMLPDRIPRGSCVQGKSQFLANRIKILSSTCGEGVGAYLLERFQTREVHHFPTKNTGFISRPVNRSYTQTCEPLDLGKCNNEQICLTSLHFFVWISKRSFRDSTVWVYIQRARFPQSLSLLLVGFYSLKRAVTTSPKLFMHCTKSSFNSYQKGYILFTFHQLTVKKLNIFALSTLKLNFFYPVCQVSRLHWLMKKM